MKNGGMYILAGLFSLLLMTGVCGAQPREGASSRPVHYDLKTVETVSGIVVAAPRLTPKEGVLAPAQLTLKTKKETLPVYLGPSWFVEKQGLKIADLDQIRVTGSRIMVRGKPALLAGEIRKGDRVLKLRNEQGQPLWRPSPRR